VSFNIFLWALLLHFSSTCRDGFIFASFWGASPHIAFLRSKSKTQVVYGVEYILVIVIAVDWTRLFLEALEVLLKA
jgi:hypothetical protein